MSSPLADLIQRGESGSKSYDNYNRGTYRDSEGRERIRGADRAIDFSTLTIGQVQDAQALPSGAPDRLFAVGRFQVIPQTMTQAIRSLGLDRNAAFTDEVQDRIFFDYLITEKRPAIRDFITGQAGVTLHAAQRALSQEWASIADPATGRSYYDKPGGANHASITAEETADALGRMREVYRTSIDDGLTPAQAWTRLHGEAPAATQSGHTPHASVVGALSPGERGDQVRLLQSQLSQLGYTGRDGRPLATDGIFGPGTQHAVERFQHARGLDVDGIVGPLTRDALATARDAVKAPTVDREPVVAQPGPLHALLDAARRVDPDALRAALDALSRSPAGAAFAAQQAPVTPAAADATPHAQTPESGIER